jgi:hypothetical protein
VVKSKIQPDLSRYDRPTKIDGVSPHMPTNIQRRCDSTFHSVNHLPPRERVGNGEQARTCAAAESIITATIKCATNYGGITLE